MKGDKEKSIPMKKQGKEKSGSDVVPYISGTPHSTRRSKRDVTVIESPDWLPKGWITELKTRVSGDTAGITDKYYYDPVANRRFPSKKKVFEFLEIEYYRGYETKRKKDDPGSRTSTQEKTNTRVGDGGIESTFPKFSTSQNTSGIDANKGPSKVVWVLNSSEESWMPLNDEEMKGSNREGEKPIPPGNSIDSCGQEQLKNGVPVTTNPSKGLTNESSQPEIDLNKPNEGSAMVSPFGDSWPDPCLEFAFKTLTGAIPIFDDNSVLQDAFQHYFSPQAKADEKLCSNSSPPNPSNPEGRGCNEHIELPSSTEQRALPSRKEFDGNNDNRISFSVSDDLPMKVNNPMRHQAKDLLEPLGRKICKKALAFLMKNAEPIFFLEKQKQTMSLPLCLS